MKESVLKAFERHQEYFMMDKELTEKSVAHFIYDNFIKNITVEDVEKMLITHPSPIPITQIDANFCLKFSGRFSLPQRVQILNEQLLVERLN